MYLYLFSPGCDLFLCLFLVRDCAAHANKLAYPSPPPLPPQHVIIVIIITITTVIVVISISQLMKSI